AYVRVSERQAGIRVIGLTSAHRKRLHHVYVMHIGDVGNVRNISHVGDVHHVHAIEAASVPRIKRIMRTHRKPSDGAKAEAGAVSKADEEDKRRRPNRTIAYKYRARPPAPVVLIVDPAAIVIWRPAPGLIGNPSPAVIRFPHP